MEIQISMFEILEDPMDEKEKLLRKALLYGSVMEGGNDRIIDASTLPKTKFVEFLKKEFYYSGHSMDNVFCNYSPKGLDIWRKNEKDLYYNWNKIADTYIELIDNGLFIKKGERK